MRTPHHLQLALLALASALTLGADGCRKDDEEDDDGAGESEGDDDAADDDDADDDADPSADDDADPSAGDDADPSAGDDDGSTDDGADGSSTAAADEGPMGDFQVAGTVSRSEAAAPFEGNDAIGDVYVVAFADACRGNPVADGMVAGADLSDPASAVPFAIEGLAPGTYFVTGFLDDNQDYDPADPGPNTGDIVMADGAMPGCAEVEVVDADAEGVAIVLTFALPFDPP
jgi:hypothetical protein